VTSSQPIVTPNAINFTPDNLRCYAYSGVISDASSAATSSALLFETTSYYLDAKLTITNDEAGGGAQYIECFFNDIKVLRTISDSSGGSNAYIDTPFYLLIPPFTKFELKVGANTDTDFTAWLSADVYGSIETGYQ